MDLQHFVLTRFSVRIGGHGARKSGGDWRLTTDLFHPDRLETRFRLFEICCLPSLVHQTAQDFDWIIIVDPALPPLYRRRLETLVSSHKRIHLHDYVADTTLGNLSWLSPYMRADAEGLLTTIVDDDDAPGRSFVERLQMHAREDVRARRPIRMYGTSRALEWDLDLSDAAPLGYVAPWHRRIQGDAPFIVSPGYSLLVCDRAYDCSAFGLPSHVLAGILSHASFDSAALAALRTRFAASLKGPRAVELLEDLSIVLDLGPETEAAVMTNHAFNDQDGRLGEYKPSRVRVLGPEYFPGVPIDWAAFARYWPLRTGLQRSDDHAPELVHQRVVADDLLGSQEVVDTADEL